MKLLKQSLRHPVIRVLGSLSILGLLLFFVPVHKLAAALRSIPLSLWLLVVLGYLATHIVGVTKWRLILRLSQAKLSFCEAVRCYYAGLFGTVFLPSVVGGDVIRMGLAFRVNRNKAGIVLGSLVDRLLDIVSLGIVAGIGVLLLPGALDPHSRKIFLLLVIGFVVAIVSSFLVLVAPWRRLPFKLRRIIVKLRRAWLSVASQPGYVLIALGLGIMLQTALVGLSSSIAGACGLHVRFHIWLLVWPLAKLLALVPVTLGGLGIREAGLAALLAPFGAPTALAVAAGLSWESIIIAGGLLAGLISFFIGGTRFAATVLSPTQLRPIAEELNPPPS